MLRERRLVLAGALVTLASALASCSATNDASKNAEMAPRVEANQNAVGQPIQMLQPTPTPAETKPLTSSPPRPEELNEAVTRVFQKAAITDTTRNPNFVIGDFNGDGSEDLAVVTKPGENSLAEINSEFANWTLEDPNKIPIPGTRPVTQMNPPVPVRAEKAETLLAIIHGVGPKGWRNPEAKQTFLLKNGVGSDMTSEPARTLLNSKDKRALPPLQGDAIREKLHGKPGMLFWTGAKYAWYSPPAE